MAIKYAVIEYDDADEAAILAAGATLANTDGRGIVPAGNASAEVSGILDEDGAHHPKGIFDELGQFAEGGVLSPLEGNQLQNSGILDVSGNYYMNGILGGGLNFEYHATGLFDNASQYQELGILAYEGLFETGAVYIDPQDQLVHRIESGIIDSNGNLLTALPDPATPTPPAPLRL